MPTRDPNLEPRRETMCLLLNISNHCKTTNADLPDVRSHNVTMVRVRMRKDVLNEIVSVLVACDLERG